MNYKNQKQIYEMNKENIEKLYNSINKILEEVDKETIEEYYDANWGAGVYVTEINICYPFRLGQEPSIHINLEEVSPESNLPVYIYEKLESMKITDSKGRLTENGFMLEIGCEW